MASIKKIIKFPPAQQDFAFTERDNDPPISEPTEIWEVSNTHITTFGYVIKNGKVLDFLVSPRHRKTIGLKTVFANYFLKKKINVKGNAISFVHGWYDNYYHFVAECLPKLYVLKDYLENTTVVFPIEAKNFHKEYMSILGIKNLTYVDHNQVVNADKVVSCNFMNRDLNHHQQITPEFRDWILSKISMNFNSELPTRFFINREKATYRKVINNEELKENFENLENINLEDYSVLEQIQVFSQAKEIQAVHGASLSNLIFCKEGTIVKEYIHQDFKQHCFDKLANTLKLKYTKIQCEGNKVHELPGYCDILIPIQSL